MVERGGLENRCAGNRTEGSNPSLSAILEHKCERRSPPFSRHLKTLAASQLISGAYDLNFMLGDLDLMRECSQMVAPKSAVFSTNSAALHGGEFRQLRRREALIGGLEGCPRMLGVHARLVACRLQFLDPLFQRWVAEVGDAASMAS